MFNSDTIPPNIPIDPNEVLDHHDVHNVASTLRTGTMPSILVTHRVSIATRLALTLHDALPVPAVSAL